ncbi:S8 family serine peptidase [Halalkalibaculum sp. DA3122]|uniref:S8 family serine peptidase n=1 Tax=Halalkalibaculum sp. DA3122 TaxID=3373607 RepID=UPI0037549C82
MKIYIPIFAVTFSILLLVPGLLPAQGSRPQYLPNTLIIKYEDQQTLGTLRQKSGTEPKDKIHKFLNRFGAAHPRPIWEQSQFHFRKNEAGTGFSNNSEVEKAVAGLQRIYSVRYAADIDPAWLAAKVSRLEGVEYAEPRYLRFTQHIPDEEFRNPYEEYHHFYDAWEVTQGSPDVVIAIIDSGVDYNHSDLDEKLWENEDEIAGDNIDNDGNGFVDDVIGWDFWAGGTLSGDVTEDNDPMMDANDHGTHVAGIAAAETDNGLGLAGAGYKARYMAVKAGGVPADPEAIAFGFEGILYAASNGADVINCSWGGYGSSEAEKEVIEYATRLGAVVVGAAGNEGNAEVIYPAGYNDVVSVGSVEPGTDRRSGYSNYGLGLDVLATGSGIQSTVGNNGFGAKSGTSMSTPVVSGLAALLRARHPGWSARRIAQQIRVSSDRIDMGILLGRGKINASTAVSSNFPGIEVDRVGFVNEIGQKLGFDEPGRMEITLVNYGASTSNLEMNAASLSGDGIQLREPTRSLGSISTDDTVRVTVPLQISSSFNLEQVPTFVLEFEDSSNGYEDFDVVRYGDLLYDTMAENRVKISISADGTIGFTDPLSQEGGVGFIPRDEVNGQYVERNNLLFEGGLMLQVNRTMHDAVRTADGAVSRDFNPQSTVRLDSLAAEADLKGHTHFTTDTVNNRSAHIELTTYAFRRPNLSNTVLMLYQIRNPSSYLELEEVYAGLFNDWDIGEEAGNNGISYSPQDSILYIYDEDPESTQPFVAVASLGPTSSVFAIDNAASGRGANFGIYDGFTDDEKKYALSAGTEHTSVSGADASAVVASGPYTVGANATVRVGFVYAFGDNLDELRSQIQAARAQKPFQVSGKGRVQSAQPPQVTDFFQNYPNPFNGSTRLRLDLAEKSHVNISIYNILGQKVGELVDSELGARIHIFHFDAQDLSSGIYFAHLQTESRSTTIKLVLVR